MVALSGIASTQVGSKNYINSSSSPDLYSEKEQQEELDRTDTLAVKNFAKLKNFYKKEIQEIANKFLIYFNDAKFFDNQTTLEKIALKLDGMSLITHSGPRISKFSQDFFCSLKEGRLRQYHPISKMAEAILRERPDFHVIKKFFKLTELTKCNELKATIVGFLALFAGKETWAGYIKENGESEEALLRRVAINLLHFANDQSQEISKPILDFATHLNDLKGRENQQTLEIAAVILAVENFLKLKLSSATSMTETDVTQFKNTVLAYLQTDNAPEEKQKEVFESFLKRFVNTADEAASKSLRDLLTCLDQAKVWQGHWLSDSLTAVLAEKAFADLVRASQKKNKDKRSDMEKLALKLSFLLESKEVSIEDGSLKRQANHLVSRLYDQQTGRLKATIPETIKPVMNFLDVLVKSRQWKNQNANALVLDAADVIVALRDFLALEISVESEMTKQEIKDIKEDLLAYLKTENASKAYEEKLVPYLEYYLIKLAVMKDKAISQPAYYLLTCLNKSEVWKNYEISNRAKALLREKAISPFISQLNNLEEVKSQRIIIEGLQVFLADEETWSKGFKQLISIRSDIEKEMRSLLERELAHLKNHSSKRASELVTDLLKLVINEDKWKGHSARTMAENILGAANSNLIEE